MRPEIKFCGMTRSDDVGAAAAFGANYVGVIFAGGPRHQAMDTAQIVLMGAFPPPVRVGVFANQTPIEIAGFVHALRLGVVQLHADPEPQRVRDIRLATDADIWAVMRVDGDTLPASFEAVAEVADAIVLDAKVPGGLGGTGVRLPWAALAKSLEQRRGSTRIVLAGGLNPDNVAEAIGMLDPDVVDVSSGIESAPGIKDHDRMRAFRDAVQTRKVRS